MKVMLIDDEQLALEGFEFLLAKIEGIQVIGKYINPREALTELSHSKVDVIFLDMEMGELHGLEFAEILQTKYPHLEVVFVTAYPQFALEAFEVHAVDYLLKPVRQDRLLKTINKLQERLAVNRDMAGREITKERSLSIQAMGHFRLLDPNQQEVKWRTRKVKELFVLLWHSGEKGIHRSQVMIDLWPELSEDKAKTLMYTTVYQLRKVMKTLGFESSVVLRNEQYVLNVEVESDVAMLEMKLQSAVTNQVQHIIELYQGDYLGLEDYQWAVAKQKETKRIFLNYLEKYIPISIGNQDASYIIESCLEKMIQLDPYREKYVYLLLDYYGRMKNKQKMGALFQEIKTKWIDELGIDLPKQMIDLYENYITS